MAYVHGNTGSTFYETFVERLPKAQPQVWERLKDHWKNVDKKQLEEDLHIIRSFANESVENSFSVCLHVSKFAPRGSNLSNFWLKRLTNFIDSCYYDDKPEKKTYIAGILDFLRDEPFAYQYFRDYIRAWDEASIDIAIQEQAGKRSPGGTDFDGP